MARYESIVDLIGNTPLVDVSQLSPNPNVKLLVKLEGYNPGGSVKDRIARSMVLAAETDGSLRPGQVIIESSSGNTGIGLALVSRSRGYQLKIVLPENVSPIQADLTQRGEVSNIFQQLGRIDALVNCAGVAYLSRIIDGNAADWEEMWRVNVMALALCCQLSLRHRHCSRRSERDSQPATSPQPFQDHDEAFPHAAAISMPERLRCACKQLDLRF